MQSFLGGKGPDEDCVEKPQYVGGEDSLPASFELAVVTPILDELLGYIKGSDGKAERYLDDYQREMEGLPYKEMELIKTYLNIFDFNAALVALLALAARHGIKLSSDAAEDRLS
jgi:hypothetical protein